MKLTSKSASDFPRAIRFGVSYYPEFWQENRWAEDLDRMKEMGLRIVRVGEFAWSQMEPECDSFQTAWIERFCGLAAERELKILFCTPTATPPKWLMHGFADSRHVDHNGRITQLYGRKYYCPNSVSLREPRTCCGGRRGRRGLWPGCLGGRARDRTLRRRHSQNDRSAGEGRAPTLSRSMNPFSTRCDP